MIINISPYCLSKRGPAVTTYVGGEVSVENISLAIVGQSAFIIFREGAEALLIIAALAAYLARAGMAEKTRVLYLGAGLAVIASLILAYVFHTYFDGMHNDIIEGGTMVLASLVLLYVSGWLFARRDVRAWQGYLHDKVGRAVRENSGFFTLGLMSFLAVFREGAETVLFMQALASGGSGWGVGLMGGILMGLSGLVVLFVLVRALAVRLPIKPFFTVTAGMLYAMAVLFMGSGVLEFQELGWLPYTDAPLPDWFVNLGANPTWEGFGLQVILVALVPLALKLPAMRPVAEAEAS